MQALPSYVPSNIVVTVKSPGTSERRQKCLCLELRYRYTYLECHHEFKFVYGLTIYFNCHKAMVALIICMRTKIPNESQC